VPDRDLAEPDNNERGYTGSTVKIATNALLDEVRMRGSRRSRTRLSRLRRLQECSAGCDYADVPNQKDILS
jgi:hypothetical protein